MTALKKPALVWLVVIVVLNVSDRLAVVLQNWDAVFALFGAAVLLYTPTLVGRRQSQKVSYLDLGRADIWQSVKWLFWVSLLVFPLFLAANHVYQTQVLGRMFSGFVFDGAFAYFLNHLVLVALPEEVFFRGYLETELTRVFKPQWQLWKAPFGWGVIFSAFIFAFSHSLIHFRWWHFSIFFPALLFSWLRQKTGTVWASVVFHALCNVAAFLISKNY